MGSNNKKQTGYGPNAGQSGSDPRGRVQNQSQYQQQRYENQQGPMVNAFAQNYGRASETDYADYNDIMNRYRGLADSSAGGTPGVSRIGPISGGRAGYTDPFQSYGGYQDFAKTGGYSDTDMANMRARGTAPVRAAYANAEREVNRQRGLQGGYSPNAVAAQARMAREQSQSGSDAMQNVEAGLAQARNAGRLSGLEGMRGIEGSRLGADVDISKFNAGMQLDEGTQNAQIQQWNNQNAFGDAQNRNLALQGMTQLYGTTPGMSNMFGNQLLQGVDQGGRFGLGLMGNDIQGGQLPGQYDQTMGRFKDLFNTGAGIAYPWLEEWKKQQGQGMSYPQQSVNNVAGQIKGY